MRDSTKFIPIHKFTNIDFASDYKFLEQITKNVASYKKGVGHYQHNERKFLPRVGRFNYAASICIGEILFSF